VLEKELEETITGWDKEYRSISQLPDLTSAVVVIYRGTLGEFTKSN
jgi:hypothetical protein